MKRLDFSSFNNLIIEDQTTSFEEPEVIAEDTTFSEDYNIFGNFNSELPIVEEPPKEQFVLVASTSVSLAIVQGPKTYQRKVTKPN